MAITYVGGATASNAAGAQSLSLTVNVPSGTANGDVMVACVYKNSSATTLNVPSGWTIINTMTEGSALVASMYYRVASSEPASYNWTLTGTAAIWGVGHFTFRGVDTAAPIHQSAKATYTTEDPATAPSVTTTKGGSTIITYRASRGSTTTEITHAAGTPTPGTERADWGLDGGTTTRNGAVYTLLDQSAGSHAYQVDMTGGSLLEGIMYTVALALEPATGTLGVSGPSPAVSIDAEHVIPGTLDVTGPSPAVATDGTVSDGTVDGDLTFTGPRPVTSWSSSGNVAATGSLPFSGPSPVVSAAGDTSSPVGDVLIAGPSPTMLMGSETRPFGERVHVVPAENRTYKSQRGG